MFKSPNSSIFQKENQRESSFNEYELCGNIGQSFNRNGYQIADLERKLQTFGGMDSVEEDIINELNRSSQRLDTMVSKLRGFLKLQPGTKDRKSTSFTSYSPSAIQSQVRQVNSKPSFNTSTNQKAKPQQKQMRLKDRVQKVLQQQDSRSTNIQKQPKYIK